MYFLWHLEIFKITQLNTSPINCDLARPFLFVKQLFNFKDIIIITRMCFHFWDNFMERHHSF